MHTYYQLSYIQLTILWLLRSVAALHGKNYQRLERNPQTNIQLINPDNNDDNLHRKIQQKPTQRINYNNNNKDNSN
jgi:hypothetical protein